MYPLVAGSIFFITLRYPHMRILQLNIQFLQLVFKIGERLNENIDLTGQLEQLLSLAEFLNKRIINFPINPFCCKIVSLSKL